MNPHSLAKEVKHLKRGTARWIAARRPCPQAEEGDVLLWINANSGQIISHDVVSANAPPSQLWESFRRALCEPTLGAPVRPRRVQAACPQLGSVLKSLAPLLDFEAEVRKLPPQADELLDNLVSALRAEGRSYLDVEGVTPELVGALATKGAIFAERAPWDHIVDSELFSIGGLAEDLLFCSVMGGGGIEYGVGVFRTEEVARQALAGELRGGFPGLSITFEPVEALGRRMAADAARHGWELTAQGEIVVVLNCAAPELAATPEDIQLAIEVLDVVGAVSDRVIAEGMCPLAGRATLGGKDISFAWPAAV